MILFCSEYNNVLYIYIYILGTLKLLVVFVRLLYEVAQLVERRSRDPKTRDSNKPCQEHKNKL